MPTNAGGIRDVYLVRVPSAQIEEAFVRMEDARAYADSWPAAEVTAIRIRQSMAEALTVVERRLIVDDERILADSTTETPAFCDSEESRAAIGEVDVESFTCGEGHWHILGFGTDRRAVLELTEKAREECAARRVPDRRQTARDRCALAS